MQLIIRRKEKQDITLRNETKSKQSVATERNKDYDEEGMVVSDKIHRVVFLGSPAVGKSSLIDQLMSSEHTNVYQNNVESRESNYDERLLKVCVNNQLMSVSVREMSDSEECANTELETEADCFVLVYAVDDEQSFGESISMNISR